jgi:acetolactate synthase-1/2/3 large subunit
MNRMMANAPTDPPQRTYRRLAAALAAAGVDTVFCVMGDGNLDLLVELADAHGVRLVHARHEQGAVAMADGYARRTGRLGVASVTHGPGLTQTGTSLKVASARRSTILVLAGDTPTGDPHHIQGFEQAPYATAVGATPVPLRAPATWAADLAEALAVAERGPVVFNLPTDHQLAAAPAAAAPPAPAVRPASVGVGLDPAAAVLGTAARPVVLAGRGAIDAQAEVAAIAALLGAPVVGTLGAHGILPEDPRHLGFVGGLGCPAAVAALDEADAVLAVGASLNAWTTKGGALLAGKPLVRLDADPVALRTGPATAVALLGDAAATLAALAGALPVAPAAPWTPSVAGTADAGAFADGVGAVDPRRALAAVEAALPRDRTIVLDGGHFITFACSALSVEDPRRFLFSCDFAAIGQGLAMAVGAAAADATGRTTLVAGDGGLLMGIAELDTAVRNDLPINIIVLNDGAYGQEVHSLAAKGKRTAHAIFAVPDLARLAEGFGATGAAVGAPADLDALPHLLTAPGGPRLIDIRINPEIVSPAAQEIFRQVRQGVELETTAAR